MRFTELAKDDAADFWRDCSKNLNNRVEHWIKVAKEVYDIDLTETEALRTRAQCRASEDRLDRFHPMLRNDGPWF